jgi:hypothetical protein
MRLLLPRRLHGVALRLLVARQQRCMPSQGLRKSKLRKSCAASPARRPPASAPRRSALDIAGQREILAQRMPLEAVVGQDAAQVRVVRRTDAVQSQASRSNQPAEGKTPVTDGTGVSSSVVTFTRMRWLWLQAQQVIDDVEALLALRIVDAADVDQLLELAVRVVAQKVSTARDRSAADDDRQLAVAIRLRSPITIARAHGLPGARQAGSSQPSSFRHVASARLAQRSNVPVRRIFFCSCSMP